MKAITLISMALAPLALVSAQSQSATLTTTILATQTTTVIYTVTGAHPSSMSLYPTASYSAVNGTGAPTGSGVASTTTAASSISPSIAPAKPNGATNVRAGYGLAAAAVVAAAAALL